MTPKPSILRQLARGDIEAAVDFYAAEAGEPVALRFVDALETALRMIGRHPAAGSPRLGQELDLPGLRTRLLNGFPYLVFYVERQDHVDVWRVLHGHRDIPAWLQEPDG
ncbi:type II toxin-antitoxin system RelE/ParE family toxin [Phenylobacterium sp.]|uniref:type II toxin-antitoxin system RelE/ParE family toxin n=1 Tax=Phenylobacterium sp. TaxID=1871053 RepID=UPI002DF0A116|nr:type II toxin-antitoxin system RelE/ParE family toxin [Phenylobacterium sp.]